MNKPRFNHLAMVAGMAALLVALSFLPPTQVVSSSPAAQDPPRVVLAEYFTGTWCPFCPASSGALERLQARIGRSGS